MILIPEYYLEFDGVDDYLLVRTTGALDFALPIKVDFDNQSGQSFAVIGKTTAAIGNDEWTINSYQNSFGFIWKKAGTLYNRRVTMPIIGRQTYELFADGGDIVQNRNGIEIDRFTHSGLPSTNSRTLEVGMLASNSLFWFTGKIYNFQIGTEIFPMNEGSGTTITGSSGTILDINGATWNYNLKKYKPYIGTATGLKEIQEVHLGTTGGFKNIYTKV